MVQIKCHECGEYVSTSAKSCKNCGHTIDPNGGQIVPRMETRKVTKKPEITMKNQRGQSFEIDCAACKLEGGMEAASITRFSGFIRFIGIIIAIPSVIGMAIAVIMFLQGGLEKSKMDLGESFFVFGISAVSGLIGWILLMKKNVFRCVRCGYIINRS